MIRSTLVLALSLSLHAEIHTLSLREAVDVALKQNPELLIARYDQARARYTVQISRDPFVPKVFGGSGAAYTAGYPASINGQPPSIFQAQTQMSLYNKPQSYKVAEARENVRAADVELSRSQEDIAYRTAGMWLDALQIARSLASVEQQAESLRKVNEGVNARIAEGRALPIEARRAALDIARSEQRIHALAADLENAETALAVTLGYPPDDRVRADRNSAFSASVPASEQSSIDAAVANSKDMRLFESRIQAKGLELKSYTSARLPVVDLVAQYNLLAQYNFQDFFGRFQRNNGQLGVSVTIPLLVGAAAKAYAHQAENDLAKLQAQSNLTRNQIIVSTKRNFQQVRTAETARSLARMDLEVAREQVTLVLAQQEEGRAAVRDLEQARIQETEKFIALYEAEHALDRAKLELLRQTGTLIAAIQ